MLASSYATGFVLGFSLLIAIGAQNAFVLRQGLLRQHVFAVVLFCNISNHPEVFLGVFQRDSNNIFTESIKLTKEE